MLAETCRTNLLALASAYHAATGDSFAKISKVAYGNGTFFRDIQKKRPPDVSLKKIDGLLNWFDQHWPDETPWPLLRAVVMRRQNGRAK